MTELLVDFKAESVELATQMLDILEQCEAGTKGPAALEEFGMFSDRIMGAAKTIVLQLPEYEVRLKAISEFTELCKLLGYKTSQLKINSGVWPVALAILLDAAEEIMKMINAITDESAEKNKNLLAKTLLDRLAWLNQQYSSDIQGTVPMRGHDITDSSEVQDLLTKLSKMK